MNNPQNCHLSKIRRVTGIYSLTGDRCGSVRDLYVDLSRIDLICVESISVDPVKATCFMSFSVTGGPIGIVLIYDTEAELRAELNDLMQHWTTQHHEIGIKEWF